MDHRHDPKPGDTVKAWMHTTDGQLVHAEVLVEEALDLNCGCRKLTATRPGPVFDLACTNVALRTGCGWHPNSLSTDLAEASGGRHAPH